MIPELAAFYDLEQDILDIFFESVEEEKEAIEEVLLGYDGTSLSEEMLNDLFRNLHSFKGNLSMCYLAPFIPSAHSLESVLLSVRQEKYPFSDAFGEVFLLLIQRVYKDVRQLTDGETPDWDYYPPLNQQLEMLAQVVAEEFDYECERTRHYLLYGDFGDEQVLSPNHEFLQLVKHMEVQGLETEGRAEKMLALVHQLNQQLNQPEDPLQLETAALVSALSRALVSVPHDGRKDVEQAQLASAQSLLALNGSWPEANAILTDAQERHDGSGYPSGKQGEEIRPGGQILAMVNLFFSRHGVDQQKTYKQNLLTLTSSINSLSGREFAPEYVGLFNDVVRQNIKSDIRMLP